MNLVCPKCRSQVNLFSDHDDDTLDALGLVCSSQECRWKLTMGSVMRMNLELKKELIELKFPSLDEIDKEIENDQEKSQDSMSQDDEDK